jgi:hypothetical protein
VSRGPNLAAGLLCIAVWGAATLHGGLLVAVVALILAVVNLGYWWADKP